MLRPLPAPAQSGEQPIALDEVVVSPTGVPTPTREIASSVTVVTAEEIERQQHRTLPQALAAVPGLNLVQTGGPGGQSSVFMRGTNANHVKVLVDGIDVSDPSAPNRAFDFGQMLTSDIERIEVLRGPQSGLYGANALGGVIAITTRRGEGPPKLAASVEAGSYGSFNQSLGLSGGNDRFDYAFGVSRFRSDSSPVTPARLVPAGRRRNPDGYDNWSYSARLGASLTDTLSASWVGRYSDGHLLFTGDSGFPSRPDSFRSSQNDRQAFTRGEIVWDPLDGRFVNRFGLSYSNQDRSNRRPDAFGILGLPAENLGERIKYDWRGDLKITQGQTLAMGLQYENERFDTPNKAVSSGNRGAFLEWQSNWSERFFTVANIRYDHDDEFGGHTTYRIAPVFIMPGTDTKLKASYGTGFKAPTLSERFSDSRPAYDFHGNPDLKPEQSRGWDLGFEQPLLNGQVNFGATWFHNDIDELILTNRSFTSYDNVGRATTKGVEAFAALELTPQLKVRADYTFTLAKDETARQELLRRPRHKLSVTARWNPVEKLTLSATLIHLGARMDGNRDFSIPRLRAPGATIVNLAADYRVDDRFTLFGRVDNLFDKRHENPVGFLVPGLGAFGGVRVSL
ncbi:TonB-dependent receptor [Bosea sp. CS1GBMeth4]|uniref:TonB-dependent receptor plug domain-containing protein n=1 Tax=Bosea sp. CS1GBMeth4 TaxID=1892849 RepID=UPI001644C892|nr:TonB-dependent receptor [Bosea sp. CS1GBMeth4]